jgi:peptidoglycan/xylan/chitin deacetylase (PgdA/CDA1 family)
VSGIDTEPFSSSAAVVLFDHFRVPYRVAAADGGHVAGLDRVTSVRTGRSLLFPRATGAGQRAEWRLGSGSLFVAPLSERELQERLAALGGRWSPDAPALEQNGARTRAWRSDAGDLALPFDPNDAISAFWSERYQSEGARARGSQVSALLRRFYYLARPLLPRRVQIALRRAVSPVQARTGFPRWPVEPSLHALYDRLFELFRELAGEPTPTLAAWPQGRTWAFVLTHDVETAVGLQNLEQLRAIEEDRGYRSSWNLVPHRYRVPDETIRELTAAGFEIGVHGLKHDGRDLSTLRVLRRRLPAMREHARRWDAVGFRSPATHRRWEWMPLLGFEYDSSYPDTDPYEPQSGGCCSWLPFFNGELVELPITLPQDHTVFAILRRDDGRLWLEKAEWLRERGGLALLITHPDYMLEERPRAAYAALLDAFAEDDTAWRPLPREVAAWWRRRAATRIERNGDGWTAIGPAAAEAVVIER